MNVHRKLRMVLVLILVLFLPGGVCAEGVAQWHIQVVDSTGGMYTSLVLDTASLPHISYWTYPEGRENRSELRYAWYDGTTWQIATVDSQRNSSFDTALALDSLGNPHIAFHVPFQTYGDYGLKYAFYNGIQWQIQVVDRQERVGLDPSLALDAEDRPHIAYSADEPFADLRYARYDRTSWQTETVDSEGYVGNSPSLAIDAADWPHIGYIGRGPSLTYARYDGTAWWFETAADEAIGCVSLALDTAGWPHMSYCSANGDATNLMYAHFDGRAWHQQLVDDGKDVGSWASLALDTAQRPHIAYFDRDKWDLKYAYFDGNSWQTETVDSYERVGTDISLALDTAGQPHISYYDLTNDSLNYASRSGTLLPGTGISPGVLPASIIAVFLFVVGVLSRYTARRACRATQAAPGHPLRCADHDAAEQDDHSPLHL